MSETANVSIQADPVTDPKCPHCSAPLPETGHPPLSDLICPSCGERIMFPGKLGPFRLMRLIGAGGMGGVYEAVDESLQRRVAIKVILRTMTEEPSFLETFRREAQSAAKLNHPHIVQIYSFGELNDQPYIVMELVQPDSLDRMMKNGPVSPATAIRIGEQVAEGLKQAAEMGIVHGDVKPENILVDETRNAKLADFGIAALAGAKAGESEVWGTPYYIAPETLRRQKVDYRADIYSLGGTLYHAMAGVPPYEGDDAIAVMKARLQGPPPPLKDLVPGIPDNVNALIMRMLEPEAAHRYPTYESLLADMRSVLATLKSTAFAGKKVVIKGKGATSNIRPTSSKISIPAGVTRQGHADILDPVSLEAFTIQRPQDEAAAGARRVKLMIVGGIIGLLVLVGLIVGLVVAVSAPPKAKETPVSAGSNAEETAEIEKFVAQLNTQRKEVQTLTISFESAVKEATPIFAGIVRDVRRGTRPQFHNSITPPELSETPYTPPAEAQPQAETSGQSPTDTDAGETAELTLPETAIQTETQPPADSTDLPRLVTRAHEAYARFYLLKEAARIGKEMGAWIEVKTSEASAANVSLAHVRQIHQTVSDEVKAFKAKYNLNPKSTIAYIAQTASVISRESPQALRELQREDRERHEAELAARKAETERQETERRAQLEQNEIETTKGALASIISDLQAFEFDAATRKFNLQTATFQTDKGKESRKVPLERIDRLRSLQNFMTQKMPEFQGRYKITEANKDKVFINGKAFPWSEITKNRPEVMVEQIYYFLVNEEKAKPLRLSERANQSINAALFCKWLVPGNSPTVEKISDTLIDYAVKNLPSGKADVERIIETID